MHELGVYLFPEYNCAWMKKHKEFGTHLGSVPIVGEYREWIDTAVDYCIYKNPHYRTRQSVHIRESSEEEFSRSVEIA